MELVQQYVDMVDGYKLISLFILIALDFILGIVLAVINHQFSWSKLAGVMDTDILKLVGGYLLVGVLGVLQPNVAESVTAAWAIIGVKLMADLVKKFQSLGISIKTNGSANTNAPTSATRGA
jgi:hypothetical protein